MGTFRRIDEAQTPQLCLCRSRESNRYPRLIFERRLLEDKLELTATTFNIPDANDAGQGACNAQHSKASDCMKRYRPVPPLNKGRA